MSRKYVPPVVLLADELTAVLDFQTTTEVINIFSELNASGITIIMVTHMKPMLPVVPSELFV